MSATNGAGGLNGHAAVTPRAESVEVGTLRGVESAGAKVYIVNGVEARACSAGDRVDVEIGGRPVANWIALADTVFETPASRFSASSTRVAVHTRGLTSDAETWALVAVEPLQDRLRAIADLCRAYLERADRTGFGLVADVLALADAEIASRGGRA
jgi:hypothetical protein